MSGGRGRGDGQGGTSGDAHHAADDGVEAGLRRGGAGERRRALGERADRLELGVRRLEVGFGGG